MRLALALCVLLATSFLMACDVDEENAITGSGDLITEEYEFEDFTSVELSSAFDADISFADSFSVSLEVDDNVLELVEVTEDGDTLQFRLAPPSSTRRVTLRATITMPELSSLDLSGASHATVTGFENAESLDAVLSGASRLDGVLDVVHSDFRLSGASKVSVTGGGTEADLEASGASTLDLADFSLEIAHVNLSGASNGTVNVRDELGPVVVSGASHLRYVGQPTLTGVDSSGASTIDPAD